MIVREVIVMGKIKCCCSLSGEGTRESGIVDVNGN